MSDPIADAIGALHAPLGAAGSGRRRYAAAMVLNRAGQLPDTALEIFRICSPFDAEDPRHLLALSGLEGVLPPPPRLIARQVLELLRDEILHDPVLHADRRVGPVRRLLARAKALIDDDAAVLPLTPDLTGWIAGVERLLPPDLARAFRHAAPWLHWQAEDRDAGERPEHPPVVAAVLVGPEGAPLQAGELELALCIVPADLSCDDGRLARFAMKIANQPVPPLVGALSVIANPVLAIAAWPGAGPSG